MSESTVVDREAWQNRLHVAAALLCAWLFLTSPWVSMLRRVPAGAGFLDHAHIVLGFVALAVAAAYLRACTRDGRWRLYFPWLTGNVRAAVHDLGGLVRGRLPSADGGGLFAVIEGLLLLALLCVAVTGAAWFLLQGAPEALACRDAHIVGARVLLGLAVAHVVAVATHLFALA